jgi:diguanylate cyclase (GGDEF)-like protein/PAS domain S-box-containing protein
MTKIDHQTIRQLFDDYIQMYSSRDDRLTTHFSEDFSGFTGGGDFLVKQRDEWVAITRQDFAQVKDPLRIELKDLAVQSLAETVAVATGFFTIHLPIKDHVLSRETARLVLIFRLEGADWKITHSSISIPYHLVREGEVYPLQELVERNQFLENIVAERTAQLSAAKDNLEQINKQLTDEIAQHQQTEEVLVESEATYRSILNASPDDITIAEMDGRILLVSVAASTMFGYEGPEDGVGLSVIDFIVPADHERARSDIARMCNEEGAFGTNEYRGLRKDGSTFDIEVNSSLIPGAKGRPTRMVFIVRDITERKLAEQQIKKLVEQLELERDTAQLNAVTDSLTGLANRRYFDYAIGVEFYRLKRSGAPLSLILMDVDHFKQFNDSYGHLAGDRCLQMVCGALKAVVGRGNDIIARYGGDELIAILPGTDKDGAINLAERMKQAIEALVIPHAASATATHVTISLGVVTVSSGDDLTSQEQLVNLADTALYRAKEEGRNRCKFLAQNLIQ